MNLWIRQVWMLPTILLSWIVWSGLTGAAETVWRTAEEMHRESQTPIGITWSAQSLRDALSNLSANQRIAIWLDRRVDPTQPLELSIEDTPFKEILQRVAARVQAEMGYAGPVIYLGPPAIASKLWTLAELRQEESQRLPADVRTKWALRRAVQWPELSTPRELLQAAADDAGCKIEGLESIPHDLWPAANLPPLTLAERFTLILAGFDCTFALSADGRTIRLTSLPERPMLQREFTPRGDVSRAATEFARQFPNAAVQRSGPKLAVTGSAEDLDSIARLIRGETVRRSVAGPPEVRYSMRLKNQPLGVVLHTLEVKSGLQVSVDDNAREHLRKLVSFEVKEVTLKQLLEAAVQGTGLTFQLDGKQLRISLADK